MRNLLNHVREGCLCDPISMEDINARLDDTPYPDYIRVELHLKVNQQTGCSTFWSVKWECSLLILQIKRFGFV
jgi:hypothetical protein